MGLISLTILCFYLTIQPVQSIYFRESLSDEENIKGPLLLG